VLVPAGSALIAVGMWLMTGLDGASDWTHLMPGSIVAGLGLGMTSSVLSQAALAAVEPERAGMATGAANTFRQIGLAGGVAGLGALFAHSSAQDVQAQLAGHGIPSASLGRLADAVGNGAGVQAAAGLTGQAGHVVAGVARDATASGLDQALWAGTLIAAAATVLSVVMLAVRQD
jgi:hypothetical protein